MKISVNKFLSSYISISFIILLFQVPLALMANIFNYYDEFFEISLILIFLFSKSKIRKNTVCIIFGLIAVIIIGIFGNCISKINFSFFPISLDLIGILKPFVALVVLKDICDSSIVSMIYNKISKIFEIYILAGVVLYLPLLIFARNLVFQQERFGIPSYSFIAGNPGMLGLYVITIAAFLSLKEEYYTSFKVKIILISVIILCILTTKGSSIIFVGIFILLILFMNNKVKLWHIIIAIPLVAFLSQYQISNYIENSTSPRILLLQNGINLANESFPIGKGFGTFGDQVSYNYYSELYYQTGLSEVWGFRPIDNAMVINDNYWPMLLAQFGYIGTLIIFVIYIYLFYLINKYKDSCKLRKIMMISLFMAFMYTSLANAYLTGTLGEFAFAVLGLYIAMQKSSRRKL